MPTWPLRSVSELVSHVFQKSTSKFTPVRLPSGIKSGLDVSMPEVRVVLLSSHKKQQLNLRMTACQGFAKDDDIDSVTSLICDEDLPLSDGEEEFLESKRYT